MKTIFIRDNGGSYSDHCIEFIDASDYDVSEAELLLRRTCAGDGWMIGKMNKNDFWSNELETLDEAVHVLCYLEKDTKGILEGISTKTVKKLVEKHLERYAKDREATAVQLESTKHPKSAASVRAQAEENIRQHLEKLQTWLKKREAR